MSLSSATSLHFGEYAFAFAPHFDVTESSLLESVIFDTHAFEKGSDFSSLLNCMYFYGLSKIAQFLHTIEFHGYNYLNATNAVFKNMPKLSTLNIDFTSLTQITNMSFGNLNLTELILSSDLFPSAISLDYSGDSVLNRLVILPSALPKLNTLTISRFHFLSFLSRNTLFHRIHCQTE